MPRETDGISTVSHALNSAGLPDLSRMKARQIACHHYAALIYRDHRNHEAGRTRETNVLLHVDYMLSPFRAASRKLAGAGGIGGTRTSNNLRSPCAAIHSFFTLLRPVPRVHDANRSTLFTSCQ
ncbi:unnamed protein product, partial [Ectocarpus sp. 12 AP-2014]